MLERLKREARDRLVRAVVEGNEAQTAQLREALEASREEQKALRRQLAGLEQQVADVDQRVKDFERRQRRNLHAAADRAAVESSVEYVGAHFMRAEWFGPALDTLRHAVRSAPTGGLALEFGVAAGTTLAVIADEREETVYGFDVFTGLPEDWRPGFRQGRFGVEELPEVEGAELVVGLFEDTLPGFLVEHDGVVDFLHVDCDLYSATVTVLDAVGPRLRAGSVVQFDEYFNHQNWQDGEFKAWAEYVEKTGIEYEYIAYSISNEQVAVRIDAVPQEWTLDAAAPDTDHSSGS